MTAETKQILKAIIRILGFASKMFEKVLKKEPI